MERDDLRAALAKVKPAVTKLNTMPALRGVLLTLGPAGATFAACDMDQRITTVADCAVHAPGRVLVPHERLAQLAAKAKPGALHLELDDADGELTVTTSGGRVVATLRTMAADEFPVWPQQHGEPVSLTNDWPAILNVMHARSKDVSRPELTHVTIGGGYTFTTDTYRCARQPVAVEFDHLLLPGATVAAVATVVGDDSSGLAIVVDGESFTLEHDRTQWSGRTMPAKYKAGDLASMYDRPMDQHVTLNLAELVDAIEACGAIGTEQRTGKDGNTYQSTIIQMRGADGSGVLSLTGSSSEYGKVEASVDAQVIGDVDADFNGTYLLDALGQCESDEITVDLIDHAKPCKIVDDELELLVMPTMGLR